MKWVETEYSKNKYCYHCGNRSNNVRPSEYWDDRKVRWIRRFLCERCREIFKAS